METQEILQRLKDGNQRFAEDKPERKLQDAPRRAELTGGQHPFAVILSCADSRVVPELAFDTGLGELFTVRVAGNIANTSSLASIEYAVANLETKVIVVLGHESCGAVTAAIKGGDLGHNLNHLLSYIKPSVERSNSDAVNDVVKKNAELTVDELKNKSSIIKDAVDSGSLKIVPAYYNLGTGKVDFL